MPNKSIIIQQLKNIIKSLEMDNRQEIKEFEIKEGILTSTKIVWQSK